MYYHLCDTGSCAVGWHGRNLNLGVWISIWIPPEVVFLYVSYCCCCFWVFYVCLFFLNLADRSTSVDLFWIEVLPPHFCLAAISDPPYSGYCSGIQSFLFWRIGVLFSLFSMFCWCRELATGCSKKQIAVSTAPDLHQSTVHADTSHGRQ